MEIIKIKGICEAMQMPFVYYEKIRTHSVRIFSAIGAGDRDRTDTRFPPQDFKS